MNRGFYLGSVCGIPIRADMSVLILVGWIMLALNAPISFKLCFALSLLFSIVWHELAHSLTAMAFGGKVRDITLQLMGGCAVISEMPSKAWQEWLMAAAGPFSSFVLAGLLSVGRLFLPDAYGFGHALMANVAYMNVMLGFFNLMPAFPMDGGRMLRSTLQSSMSKVRATWVASRIGRAIAIIFIVAGIMNVAGLSPEVPHTQWFIPNLFIDFLTRGSWLKILIGFSIYQSAEIEYRMVLAQEAQDYQRRGFGGGPFSPRGKDWSVPPEDDSAIVSPPPYRKDKPDRLDIKRGE